MPLAVRCPYTNAWTTTVNGSTLSEDGAMFWTAAPLGWTGLVSVDGDVYQYMGTNSTGYSPAQQKSVVYDSQYTNFTFEAGHVEVLASFFSPVTFKDPLRQSLPLSYVSVSAKSTDGKAHDVSLYQDINGGWSAGTTNGEISWQFLSNDVKSWVTQLTNPTEFGEDNDFSLYGNFTFNTNKQHAENFTYQSGSSSDVRSQFSKKGFLENTNDNNFRAPSDNEPVFAFSHDLGSISKTSKPIVYTLGMVNEPAITYLTKDGMVSLDPWWKTKYDTLEDMVDFHFNDLDSVISIAAKWEAQLQKDISKYYKVSKIDYSEAIKFDYSASGKIDGTKYVFDPNNEYGYLNAKTKESLPSAGVDEYRAYYAIVAASVRQIMGAYQFTKPSPGAAKQDQPYVFQKEISSSGNVNTVDVLFPVLPFFYYAYPDMLQYIMNPMLEMQEDGLYPNKYSLHDIGSHYPIADGHPDGNDEYMPVEESGDMIILAYAYYKATNDAAWLKTNYALFKQWSEYLIEFSLIPASQLSTDDFAGTLSNQTDLAIKGIVALQALSKIAAVIDNASDSKSLGNTASDYYSKWKTYGIDPTNTHTLLAYQWRSSWGNLYNIYPSMLLDLDVVEQDIFTMQSNFYPTVAQMYGLPLDSRHSYTKSDWELWTAACMSPSTRKMIITQLALWLNDNPTSRPFSDLYDTVNSGVQAGAYFNARPVVGGHFATLAMAATGRDMDDYKMH
ncbi:hypothetical protein TRVA0_025S01904 [Trichomonascus vanleenenianus]|uniref:uncharacterized protein n=1 Tax=Trichomonascus vanleenenianus TaxID=2268995 RepID=UPI003EC9F7E9